jgi:hypothetical protein
MRWRRRGHALRRRHGKGRAIHGPQAISIPRADGRFDVVLVDSRGTKLQTLARGVQYDTAHRLIRGRHG